MNYWSCETNSRLSVVTAFGSSLPYLVRSRTKPNQTIVCLLPRSGLVRSGPVCVGPTIKLVQSRTGPEFDRSVWSGPSRPTADRQVYLFWEGLCGGFNGLCCQLCLAQFGQFFLSPLTSVGAMYKYSKFVIICRGEGTEGDGAIAVGNNICAARKRKGDVARYNN